VRALTARVRDAKRAVRRLQRRQPRPARAPAPTCTRLPMQSRAALRGWSLPRSRDDVSAPR